MEMVLDKCSEKIESGDGVGLARQDLLTEQVMSLW
jgi:hypothetical protein